MKSTETQPAGLVKAFTIKYNNGTTHRLDEFNTIDSAIESAKALHNPDWPCFQGIRVKDATTHRTLFDSHGDND